MSRSVHLVRHGEVENPDRLTYGRLPGFSLSARGRAQAEHAGYELKRRAGQRVVLVTSPLERAVESAEIVRAVVEPNAEIVLEPRLIESGTWREGLPRAFDLRRYAAHWLTAEARAKTEAPATVAHRMRSAIEDAVGRWPDAMLVLVSHQMPIWMSRVAFQHGLATEEASVAARLFPLAFVRGPCSPASITTLTLEGPALEGMSYWEPTRT